MKFLAGNCYGVIGANGAGKSTFLKAISKDIDSASGHITLGPGERLSVLNQDHFAFDDDTVLNTVMKGYARLWKLMQKKNAIYAKPDFSEEDGIKSAALEEEFADMNGWNAESDAAILLSDLGIKAEFHNTIMKDMSGKQKVRVLLAQALFGKPDNLLLDEPTNHLDITTKEWFFSFLQQASFGFLLVSHDRYYLDNLCDHIFELESGNGTMYTGGFSKYVELKEQRRAATLAAYERQQKDIERKQAVIDRFRAKSSKAKMAQSMAKQLDKMERIEIEPALPKVTLRFPESQRPGKVVLTVKNVTHSFGDKKLFDPSSFELMRGQKAALVAPNGMGKTTLFNLIAGKTPLQQGEVTFGYNVDVAFFEQDQTRVLKPENSVWQEVCDATRNISEGAVRSFLGSFLFSGDDIYKKISVLSGGERNRVAMVKVLLQKANLLILDEPTNHLDLSAKEVLLQALIQYDGTILVVSHDHDFIQKLAGTVLELTPEGVTVYPGSYESFLADKQSSKQVSPSRLAEQAPQENQSKPPAKNKDTQKQVARLEQKIAKLEHTRDKLALSFTSLEYGTPEFAQAQKKFRNIEKEIAQVTTEWEAASSKS